MARNSFKVQREVLHDNLPNGQVSSPEDVPVTGSLDFRQHLIFRQNTPKQHILNKDMGMNSLLTWRNWLQSCPMFTDSKCSSPCSWGGYLCRLPDSSSFLAKACVYRTGWINPSSCCWKSSCPRSEIPFGSGSMGDGNLEQVQPFIHKVQVISATSLFLGRDVM